MIVLLFITMLCLGTVVAIGNGLALMFSSKEDAAERYMFLSMQGLILLGIGSIGLQLL